jgi:hypothetical protein
MRTTQQQRQGDSQELATLSAQIRASTCWDWAEYFIPALLARVDAPTLPAGRDQPTTGVVPLPTGLPADTVQDHPFLPLEARLYSLVYFLVISTRALIDSHHPCSSVAPKPPPLRGSPI